MPNHSVHVVTHQVSSSPPPPAPAPPRAAGTGIPWHRRLSVRLALGLGLAMFAIQVLTSQLIIESYRSSTEEEAPSRIAAEPYANYLRKHLVRDTAGHWVPTDEALAVVHNFLDPGDTYVWLSPENVVLRAGRKALDITSLGADWPLCDSPAYCAIPLENEPRSAGSTWTALAMNNRPIGTFVLVWFEQQSEATPFRGLVYRLMASGLIAALASALLVSLVTRRLSKLAAEASTPLDERIENVDLPGPFHVAGEDEIARLASALNTMRGRIEVLVAHLEERDRQRREWIAQVSHDLRTPLTALSVCLERIHEKLHGGTKGDAPAAILDAIDVALQDGHRLQTLVDDLFELARLDAGEQLILEPVPPGELVRQTVRGLAPMAEAHGVTLRARVAPALPTIRADGRRLMRALENLARNAIHFAAHSVEMIVELDEGFLRFEVRDDGPGLPVENGQAVLSQSDHSPQRPDSAGLGLIVTRRVATAHGGSLGGANLPEGGAAVWIRIPIVQAD